MFKKRSKTNHQFTRRRRRGYGPARFLLSLTMMAILGVGVFSAYRAFSGIDPLKISPKMAGENLVVQLLGFSPESLFKKSIIPGKSATLGAQTSAANGSNPASVKPTPKKTLEFKFAVVTDSHNDNEDLKKALSQAKQAGAKFVVGLGDFSDVGTMEELGAAKAVFDQSGLPFYVIPGDHDLWDSRNRGLPPTHNFSSVFGPSYQSFSYLKDRFLMIDNSDNYNGLNSAEQNWLDQELVRMKQENLELVFAFTSTPLYHPSSDHVMGKVEPKLKAQADSLVTELKNNDVVEVIAGDTHFYASYAEPRTGLHMTVSGAITESRNIQTPRFLMVDQYTDGSYNIEDTEVAP